MKTILRNTVKLFHIYHFKIPFVTCAVMYAIGYRCKASLTKFEIHYNFHIHKSNCKLLETEKHYNKIGTLFHMF